MIADSSFDAERMDSPIWAYARQHLKALARRPEVRLEVGAVTALLIVLFAPLLPSWWRAWTVSGWIQNYAVFIIPLTLLWLWLNRLRLALPELDELNEQYTEASVLRYLQEEEPEPPRRLRWPLLLGCLGTPLAFWIGDPTFTCIAFLTLLIGLLAYRLGTQFLHVAAFPLAFLAAMIPLPGILFDTLLRWGQIVEFKLATQSLDILGVPTELAQEGNPILIPPKEPTYRLYAGLAGTGFSEACLFLLLAAWYLSLIDAPFRTKLGAFVCGMIWVGFLLVVRIALLAWIGPMDIEMANGLVWLTRWMIPVVGFAGQLLILRGLQCQKYQEWVSR
jgi:hypothetical protein